MIGLAVAAVLVVSLSGWAIAVHGSTLFVARLDNGLTNGALYGGVALALVLVYRATRILNFAQGAMAMVGTYLAYTFIVSWHLTPIESILLAMAASAAGAALIERVFIRPFDPANHLGITIVTLGWYLILGEGASVIWGDTQRGLPTPFPHGAKDFYTVFGARIYFSDILTVLSVVTFAALVGVLLRSTRAGLGFRAVASNLASSQLVGINIGRIVQLSWALAAAAGTFAGCVVAASTSLTPSFMGNVLIYAFIAAALGGLDSILGSVIGGILLGLVVSLVGGYIPQIGQGMSLTFAFVLIIVVLFVRPSGLFGQATAIKRV